MPRRRTGAVHRHWAKLSHVWAAVNEPPCDTFAQVGDGYAKVLVSHSTQDRRFAKTACLDAAPPGLEYVPIACRGAYGPLSAGVVIGSRAVKMDTWYVGSRRRGRSPRGYSSLISLASRQVIPFLGRPIKRPFFGASCRLWIAARTCVGRPQTLRNGILLASGGHIDRSIQPHVGGTARRPSPSKTSARRHPPIQRIAVLPSSARNRSFVGTAVAMPDVRHFLMPRRSHFPVSEIKIPGSQYRDGPRGPLVARVVSRWFSGRPSVGGLIKAAVVSGYHAAIPSTAVQVFDSLQLVEVN